jgi:hypothetical protein
LHYGSAFDESQGGVTKLSPGGTRGVRRMTMEGGAHHGFVRN